MADESPSRRRAGSPRTRPTAAWKKALFALVPLVSLFLLIEGGLAWLDRPRDPEARGAQAAGDDTVALHLRDNVLTVPDPELLFRVRPNPGGAPVHGYTGINAEGFRGRVPGPPGPDARVVLVLGDSCAFGWRIRDVERTFAARLERELAARGAPAEVYNLSQPGYSSTQTRMLYERWAPVLEPDVVILYQGWNDLWKSVGGTDREQIARRARFEELPAGWLRRSHTFRLADGWLRSLRAAWASGRAAAGEGRRVPLAESIANHRAVVDDVRRRGGRVLWVAPPFSARADPSLHPMADYRRSVAEALAGEVVAVVVPELEPDQPRSPDFFVEDAFHPNALGAERIAHALAEQLAPARGPGPGARGS